MPPPERLPSITFPSLRNTYPLSCTPIPIRKAILLRLLLEPPVAYSGAADGVRPGTGLAAGELASAAFLGVITPSIVNVERLSDTFDLRLSKLLHVVGDVNRLLALDMGLGEDDIDLFERTAGSLGIYISRWRSDTDYGRSVMLIRTEEVDDRKENGIGDGKDEEGCPTDGRGHRRQNLYDQEVEATRDMN